MAVPSINDLKMWVGTLFTKDDWDFNFSQIVDWFSGGSSDIVVNSIKATNGIDLDGAQLSNLGPATTGAQAITLDQAQTLLNRTSYFYPFSVASGKVDNNGNSAYLQKDSDTQVTVLAGNVNPDLVCIQSDATIESVTSNTVLTIPTVDGTYYIIKEKGQAISITTGTANIVTVDKAFPSSQNIGDYFLNNSTVPFVGYKYTTTGWEETPFCYLGCVTVSSGTATAITFPYNDNKYDVNRNNQSVVIESYRNGANWYELYSDGTLKQGGVLWHVNVQFHTDTISFLKNYANTDIAVVAVELFPGQADNSNSGVGNITISNFDYIHYGWAQGVLWFAVGKAW